MSDTYTEFAPLRYDQQQIAQQGYGVATSGPGDDRLIVGFYRKSVVNVALSKEQGRRVCESHDFVKIQHPGENLNIVDRKVQDSDKMRWPRQWGMFQQGQKQIPDGIPVTLLYPAQPNIADMLIGYNIHTVEQLANLSAHAIGTVGMGCQEWVNKAKTYLDQANKGVDFHRFEKEREEKDHQIAVLKKQVSDLSAQMERFMRRASPPPQNFDVQSSQIAHTMAEQNFDLPEAVNFSQAITSPDLSGEVQPEKRRPGRPRKQEN